MKYPLKKVYITQPWGVNKEYYKRWGLAGHNGTDYRARIGTNLFAPHRGAVLETHYDKGGYGKYIKIENENEGSILAHLSEIFVNVGDTVKEGQLIGKTGNTGNSTGPHLHWGYYPIPRNRGNGYSGTIDQEEILQLQKNTDQSEELRACLNAHKELISQVKELKQEREKLKKEINEIEKDYDEDIKEQKKLEEKLKSKKKEISKLKKLVDEKDADNTEIFAELKSLNNQFDQIARILGSGTKTSEIIASIERLLQENENYKKANNKLEKKFVLMENEKEQTIKDLKEEIREQQTKLEKLKSQNDNLLVRVEQLEEQSKQDTEIKGILAILKNWFDK
jgi:murein DD-endopeptidase MepM/ murein hydrolase activator NlpD